MTSAGSLVPADDAVKHEWHAQAAILKIARIHLLKLFFPQSSQAKSTFHRNKKCQTTNHHQDDRQGTSHVPAILSGIRLTNPSKSPKKIRSSV